MLSLPYWRKRAKTQQALRPVAAVRLHLHLHQHQRLRPRLWRRKRHPTPNLHLRLHPLLLRYRRLRLLPAEIAFSRPR